MKQPDVYVIIVNWNGEDDTIACLESLKHVDYTAMHVLIADNGSRGDSISRIQNWIVANVGPRPGIASCRIVENGRNLGFTGANTTGIKIALAEAAEYILFLNNDTTVSHDFLPIMVEVAGSNNKYGIVGCKILTGERDRPSGRYKVWSLGGYRWKLGIPLNLYGGSTDSPKWKGVRVNPMINGCCMLIKRAVIDQIGVQDDALFFGMDDAEFSLRAWRSGWMNVIALDAEIHHLGSHGVEAGSPLQAYYLFRNMLMFRSKYFRWYQNLVFAGSYWIRYVMIGCLARTLAGRSAVNRGVWFGIQDYFAGKTGECGHRSITRT